MNFIPNELLFEIMLKLDMKSICKLSQTNRKFNSICKDLEKDYALFFWRSYSELYNILKLFDFVLLIDKIDKSNPPYLIYCLIYERAFKGSECLWSAKRCALQSGRQADKELFDYFVKFYSFKKDFQPYNYEETLSYHYLLGLAENGLLGNPSLMIEFSEEGLANKSDDEVAYGEGFRGTDLEIIKACKISRHSSYHTYNKIMLGAAHNNQQELIKQIIDSKDSTFNNKHQLKEWKIELKIQMTSMSLAAGFKTTYYDDYDSDYVILYHQNINIIDFITANEVTPEFHLPYIVNQVDYDFNSDNTLKYYPLYEYSQKLNLRATSQLEDLNYLLDHKGISLDNLYKVNEIRV